MWVSEDKASYPSPPTPSFPPAPAGISYGLPRPSQGGGGGAVGALARLALRLPFELGGGAGLAVAPHEVWIPNGMQLLIISSAPPPSPLLGGMLSAQSRLRAPPLVAWKDFEENDRVRTAFKEDQDQLQGRGGGEKRGEGAAGWPSGHLRSQLSTQTLTVQTCQSFPMFHFRTIT